jgi:hypothetical protein
MHYTLAALLPLLMLPLLPLPLLALRGPSLTLWGAQRGGVLTLNRFKGTST